MYRRQLTLFIKKHAGNITDNELPKLYFTDINGNVHQFDSYNDERLKGVINKLVSCSWVKPEPEVPSSKEKITFTGSFIELKDNISEE